MIYLHYSQRIGVRRGSISDYSQIKIDSITDLGSASVGMPLREAKRFRDELDLEIKAAEKEASESSQGG